MTKLLKKSSNTTLAGQTGKHKHRVGSSCCLPKLTIFRKKCSHSCYTHSVQVSKKLMLWGFCLGSPVTAIILFHVKMKFDGFGKNMLQTKAAYIAWLSLSISHWSEWSLSKNKANKHVANLN